MQRPGCQRCHRLGSICPDYPEFWEVVHREENLRAAKRVERRVRKTLADRRNKEDAENTPDQCLEMIPTLTQNIDLGAEVYSVCWLLDSLSGGSGITTFDVIPQLHTTRPAACFSHALDASALALAVLESRQPELLENAKRAQCAIISILREATSCPEMLTDDSALMTIWLIGFCMYIHRRLPERVRLPLGKRCDPHAKGLDAVLKYRAQNGLDTLTDRMLLLFCRHLDLLGFFILETDADYALARLDIESIIWPRCPPLDSCIRRAVVLVCRLRLARDSYNQQLEDADFLSSETFSILDELSSHATCIAPNTSNQTQQAAFNELITLNCAASVALAKSLYLTVALHLLELLLSLAAGPFLIEESTKLHIRQKVSDCTAQLWGQINTVTGPVAGRTSPGSELRTTLRRFMLDWPLTAISMSQVADSNMKLHAMAMLRGG